jgi:hypothetical protein
MFSLYYRHFGIPDFSFPNPQFLYGRQWLHARNRDSVQFSKPNKNGWAPPPLHLCSHLTTGTLVFQTLVSQIPSFYMDASDCMREIETMYNFPNQIKMAEPRPPHWCSHFTTGTLAFQTLISQISSLYMDASVCSARMREIEIVYNFPNQTKMAEPLPPYTDVLTLLQELWHSRLKFPKSPVFIYGRQCLHACEKLILCTIFQTK